MEDGPTRTHTLHTIGKIFAPAGARLGEFFCFSPQRHTRVAFWWVASPPPTSPPLAAASSAHTHIPRRGAARLVCRLPIKNTHTHIPREMREL